MVHPLPCSAVSPSQRKKNLDRFDDINIVRRKFWMLSILKYLDKTIFHLRISNRDEA